MITRSACLLAAVLCAAPALPAAADEPLSDQELLRLFPGTFKAVVKGKYEVKVTLKRGGAIIGEVTGIQDHGRWTVRGGELCIVMPSMTRGRVECSTVISDNGWYKGRNVVFQKL